MSIKDYPVLIGALGWKHSRWPDEYYPEDIPEDWWLTFYANEFPVVVVPAIDWESESELSDWIDDTEQQCGFVLQLSAQSITDAQAMQTAIQHASQLGELCLGLVIPMQERFNTDPGTLAELAQLAQGKLALCLDGADISPNAAVMAVLEQYAISQVWHGGETDLQRGRLALLMVEQRQLAPRELRQIIETCLAASAANRYVVLCFSAESVDIELLHSADTMLGLM